MCNKIIILFFISFSIYLNHAASTIKFNGSFESIFDMNHNTDYQSKKYKYTAFGWGWNHYANLRMRADINEFLTFDMAININMFAGTYNENYKLYYLSMLSSINDPFAAVLESGNLFSIPFYSKSTYIGSFDLERLYFKAGNNYFDITSGLVRLAKGFGYFFSPTDFFNPKDPINPNARPEGKLALIATFYPTDLWKIDTFMIAPNNPVKSDGWGFKFGASTFFNIKKVNFEFLYTLLLPEMPFQKD